MNWRLDKSEGVVLAGLLRGLTTRWSARVKCEVHMGEVGARGAHRER